VTTAYFKAKKASSVGDQEVPSGADVLVSFVDANLDVRNRDSPNCEAMLTLDMADDQIRRGAVGSSASSGGDALQHLQPRHDEPGVLCSGAKLDNALWPTGLKGASARLRRACCVSSSGCRA
jgi:hypothetical protein